MGLHRCPGMAPSFFKPSDVKTRKCLNCDYEMEFWKDDVRVTCSECGHINFNPDIGKTCLAWCKKASECIGKDDIQEWLRKEAEKKRSQCRSKK